MLVCSLLACSGLLTSVVFCEAHAVRSTKRDYGRLSSSSVDAITSVSDPATYLDIHNSSSLLSRILIPRPPDTENSRKVQKAIAEVFENQLGKSKDRSGWHTDQHTFVASTPEGPKTMTNLIFTKNPAAPRKFVVSAHYDSKYFSASSGMSAFVGATDSAAPCAMMVDLAVALDSALDARDERLHKDTPLSPSISQETTLQLVFFDGEEAYQTWTHTDSIYGSRELATQWSNTFWDASQYESIAARSNPRALEARRYRSSYSPVKHMNTIEHMVLLDLLGAPNPSVPSYFESTSWLHQAMADSEKRLRQANKLFPASASGKVGGQRSFFAQHKAWGGVEDDHLPFLHAGVPILHVIPSPFPSVWHRLSDDVTALDYPTMHAWCMILRLTVAEYLGLDPLHARNKQREVQQDSSRKSASPVVNHNAAHASAAAQPLRKIELVSLDPRSSPPISSLSEQGGMANHVSLPSVTSL